MMARYFVLSGFVSSRQVKLPSKLRIYSGSLLLSQSRPAACNISSTVIPLLTGLPKPCQGTPTREIAYAMLSTSCAIFVSFLLVDRSLQVFRRFVSVRGYGNFQSL